MLKVVAVGETISFKERLNKIISWEKWKPETIPGRNFERTFLSDEAATKNTRFGEGNTKEHVVLISKGLLSSGTQKKKIPMKCCCCSGKMKIYQTLLKTSVFWFLKSVSTIALSFVKTFDAMRDWRVGFWIKNAHMQA